MTTTHIKTTVDTIIQQPLYVSCQTHEADWGEPLNVTTLFEDKTVLTNLTNKAYKQLSLSIADMAENNIFLDMATEQLLTFLVSEDPQTNRITFGVPKQISSDLKPNVTFAQLERIANYASHY